MKFGYSLVIGFFLLMMWISLSGSTEVEHFPPCFFNPLCTCSKTIPDLGIVKCVDVYLSRMPAAVNTSKVFMLHMENNALSTIEPYFLQNAG